MEIGWLIFRIILSRSIRFFRLDPGAGGDARRGLSLPLQNWNWSEGNRLFLRRIKTKKGQNEAWSDEDPRREGDDSLIDETLTSQLFPSNSSKKQEKAFLQPSS